MSMMASRRNGGEIISPEELIGYMKLISAWCYLCKDLRANEASLIAETEHAFIAEYKNLPGQLAYDLACYKYNIKF